MTDDPALSRVKKLPDKLINQIAAGEVIERPASIVKELLENSIDAQATEVSIEIERAGKRLIRIRDNGYGIHKEDLTLAVDRHTTSKINDKDALTRIATLGFRGEALASIASISRFTLTSCLKGESHAWSITDVSGGSADLQPAAHPVGTTVTVKDIFYNVPARRKFLRSEKTEFIQIQDMVRRVALSNHNLGLRLIHNQKQIINCRKHDDPANRLSTVLGKSYLTELIFIDYQSNELHVWGWIAPPELARSQTDRQYIFLNGRIIRDRQINHAVRLAYDNRVHPDRHPAYILYLEMDLGAADVNVHPTKREVRFRAARDVHDFIYSSINTELMHYLQSDQEKKEKSENSHRLDTDKYGIKEKRELYRQTNTFKGKADTEIRPLTLIGERFIVAEDNNGLILLDSHRARELITEYRLNESLENGGVQSRPVLVPITVTTTETENDSIIKNCKILQELGLVIECISPTTVLIRELPVLLPYADAITLVTDVISYLSDTAHPDVNSKEKLIRVLAQHAGDSVPFSLESGEITRFLSEFRQFGEKIPTGEYQQVWCLLDEKALSELIRHVK